MNRFVTWASFGNKSKEQLQQPNVQPLTAPPLPEGGQEKDRGEEAADPPPCRDPLEHRSADVGQPDGTPQSNGEDMVTPKAGAVVEASASKLSVHSVGSAHDSVSPAAHPDFPNPSSDAQETQSTRPPTRLKHSRSFFSTFALVKKLRIRKQDLVPVDREPDNSVPARAPEISRRLTHRPKPVPIALPDDILSRERRQEALRARGLLPRDLSAIEADQDRRMDTLCKKSNSLSSSDNTHTDANDIAQAWRIRNSKWLSESLPNLDASEDPMTQVTPPTEALSLSEGLLALVTVGADDPASVSLMGSPSISKFLTLNCPPSQSLEAASPKESISHEDSPSSRADSPIPSSPEGLMLPLSCLEDSPTYIPTLQAVKTTSAQSAPSSPAPSKTSCSLHSQIAEKPQASAPSLPSQRSVSPSRQQEDSQTPCSLPQSPSEPRIESSSKSLLTAPHPEPLDVTAQVQRSVPDLSPLLLFPLVSDILLASPTTPTLSPSVCYSSSEASDSTPTADNGELIPSPTSDVMPVQGRADITPFVVKSSEGGTISREVILEGSEPFPDDDLDPFAASPSSPPSIPTVITTPSSRSRNRSSTLGPPPSASRSPSLMGLRRTFTNSRFLRPRSRTTMSYLAPTDLSPPPSPLEVKVHNRSTIYEETTRIDDDEIRRLSELAFLT